MEIACEAGASGFVAGRSIWQEGLQMPVEADRDRFLQTIGLSRLKILVDVANYRGMPRTARISPPRVG